MRLVTVTRARNEDDIVEAFVRHHCRLVDHVILLDDGSTDRTLDILKALKAEGLPLSVYRAQSVIFVESAHNTFLLRRAAAIGADWVLCLDCDEFVDERLLPGSLRDTLGAMPPETLVVEAELVNYHASSADDAAQAIVPLRLRHRSALPSGVFKVFVRGRFAAFGGEVENGNHNVRLHGTPMSPLRLPGLYLAHYAMRTGWQMLAKAVNGRLKVLAAGRAEVERGTAVHYTELLGTLRDHPEWLLFDSSFLNCSRAPECIDNGAVHDPIDYRGGALRHTNPLDPRLHAARSLLAWLELLASRHGALLDMLPQARELNRTWDGEPTEVT
jgi:hypothetical protein